MMCAASLKGLLIFPAFSWVKPGKEEGKFVV
jgi:hypothetical protein